MTAAPQRSRVRGLSFVAVASLLFALNGSVSKAALQSGLTALQLTTFRVSGTFVVLVIVVLALRPRSLIIRRHEWPGLVVYGVVGVVAVQAFYFVAIARLPVGIALLIEYTAPLFVALWARFVQRRPIARRFWLGLAAALGGLALVAQVWQGATLSATGVLAAFGAAASLAVYFVVGESGLDAGRDPLSFTTVGFGVAAVVMAVLQPWWTLPVDDLASETTVLDGVPGVPLWALVLWVIVLGTAVPYVFTLASMSHLTASAASVASLLEPVLAGVLAWALLDETLAPVQVAGAAVVLGGLAVAELSGAHAMRADAAVPEPTGDRMGERGSG